ncbi:MAG: hypothetical protein ACK5ZJ_07545 [Acidobacteriota bacterium]|jgi:hypothetical protein
MINYLPPSKTEPTPWQIEKFNSLYRKVHERLDPGTAEEHSVCNEVVVALWFHRLYRGQAQVLEKELKRMRQLNAEASKLGELEATLRHATHQSHLQKNFAWRRRGKFFAIKTEREKNERWLPLAA